jgi:outer membrane protein TolC
LIAGAGLLALSALPGCPVGPDYVRPKAATPEAWLEVNEPAVRSTEAHISSWWSIFNDPALNSLVEIALEDNLSMQAAVARIAEARAALKVSKTLPFPQAQAVSVRVAHVRLSENAPNFALLDTSFSDLAVGFDASFASRLGSYESTYQC